MQTHPIPPYSCTDTAVLLLDLPTPTTAGVQPINKAPGQQKQQRRSFWTLEEEENLRKGVAMFGSGKWNVILQKFQFQPGRTNVNLKVRYCFRRSQYILFFPWQILFLSIILNLWLLSVFFPFFVPSLSFFPIVLFFYFFFLFLSVSFPLTQFLDFSVLAAGVGQMAQYAGWLIVSNRTLLRNNKVVYIYKWHHGVTRQ